MGLLSSIFKSLKSEVATGPVVNPLDNAIVADPRLGFFGEEIARLGAALSQANSRKDSVRYARLVFQISELNRLNTELGFAMSDPRNLAKFRRQKARGDLSFLN